MRTGPNWVVAAMFISLTAATFESAMLYAALPTLIRDFGDPIMAGWLVTMHALIGSGTCIVVGRFGDIRGRRGVILALIALAGIGSVMSAVTADYAIVLVGRALQGFSIGVMPLAMSVLRDSLPRERVPVAVGLMTTAQGMGVAIGLVLGGWIVDNFNWHWLFAFSAVLLAIAWIAVWLFVPSRPGIPPKEPIDWVEGLLPVPGISSMLLGISLSKSNGWIDYQVIGLIVIGIAIMAYWARRSLRAKEPFIDLRILAIRNVAVINVMAVLLGMGTMQIVFLFSTFTQAPTWTMAGLGLSAFVAGMAKLPSNFLSFFAGPLNGLVMTKFGNRVPVVGGALLAATGWMLALPLPDTIIGVVALLCVISFGSSALNAAMPAVIVTSVPEGRTSEAIGTMSVLRGMAAAIGAQLIAVSLASNMVTEPGGTVQFPSATGFRITMAWIGGLTFIAAFAGLFLKARQGEDEPSEPEIAAREAA
ncbi:MAG: MFS transporter [Novosphingobium sp.]|nr:MFS transporter [Novosphingobium sp.]